MIAKHQRRILILLAAILIVAHGLAMVRWVGSGPLLHGVPVVQDDYSLHLANVLNARALEQQSGRSWGYAPGEMAGYPTGILESSNNRAAELFVAVLARPLPATQAFAWCLFLLAWLAPLACFAAARLFGLGRGSALACTVLGALYLHSFLGGTRPYLTYGMYAYAVALFLAPCALACFSALARRPGWSRAVAASLLFAIGWTVHVHFVLLTGPALACCVVRLALLRRWRSIAWSAWAVAVGVALNLYWLLPFWQLRPILGDFRSPFFQSGLHQLLFDLTSGQVLVRLLPWLIGALALPGFARAVGRGAALALGGAAGFSLVATLATPLSSTLQHLQAARLLDSVGLFLLVPAVHGVSRWAGESPRRWLAAAAALGLLAAPTIRCGSVLLLRGEGQLLTFSEDPAQTQLPADVPRLVHVLRRLTDRSARLMLEDSDHLQGNHRYGQTHLPALLPHLLGNELIGGPFQDCRLVEHRVDFADGIAFGRPLPGWTDAELLALLRTYNVGWIVAWSDRARLDLARRPFVQLRYRVGPYVVYTVAIDHGWALDGGAASVRAGFDEIRVEEAPGPVTVLKYHYLPGLRTDPPLPISAAPIPGDPVGFISVHNGEVKRFTIRFQP